MNKHLYRIIFNKARQMLMVVAEIAQSGQGSTVRRSQRSKTLSSRLFTLSSLSFSLYLASGLVVVSAQPNSNIVADHNAPRNQQPTVLETANGLPQINIQTPNAQGLSHNQYSQFDVGTRGAILNNSYKNTQTNLAGMVTANPWLAKGEAKIILNEINSGNTSRLEGFLEVAGGRAHVVIANPAGITCSGCGFINAHKATLAAGKAITENGQLKGFNVNRGQLTVEGNGMSAQNTAYTELIANAVNVNAKLYANDLNVVTGQNTVSSNMQTVETKPDDNKNKPKFALDVAAIGGMYVNAITLRGTEKGVGVRNAGTIGALAGNVTISVDGKIENSGMLYSQNELQLTNHENIANSGKIVAKTDMVLNAGLTLHNSGTIAAVGHTTLNADSINSTTQGALAAGIDDNGNATGTGNLVLNGRHEVIADGQNLAGGNLQVTGSKVDLQHSKTSATNITLTATQTDVNTSDGTLVAKHELNLDTPTQWKNNSGAVSGEKLNLKAPVLKNQEGTILQTGDTPLQLTHNILDNTGGELQSASDLNMDVGTLNNQQGKIAANAKATLTTGDINNKEGRIIANSGLKVRSHALDNTAGILSSVEHVSVDTQGHKITNNFIKVTKEIEGKPAVLLKVGQIVSGQTLALHIGDLENEKGQIVAKDGVTITSSVLNNAEDKLQSAVVHNAGEIGSQTGDVTINVDGKIENSGKITAAGHTTLNADSIDSTNQGTLASGIDSDGKATGTGNLVLNGRHEVIANGKNLAGGDLQVAGGKVDLQHSKTYATNITLTATQTDVNTSDGTLVAKHELNLDTPIQWKNNSGALSGEKLNLKAPVLENQEGIIQQTGNTSLQLTNDFLNNTGGTLLNGGDLNLKIGTLNNQKGKIATNAKTMLIAGGINNIKGQIAGNKGLEITSQALDNTEGKLQSAAELTIDTNGQKLINQQGTIASNSKIILTTGDINNIQGQITGDKGLEITSQALDSTAGKVLSAANVSVDTQGHQLTNAQNGVIASDAKTTLVTGNINNTKGQIAGNKGLVINSQAVDNTKGKLQSAAELTVNTQGEVLTNQQGTIASNAKITLATGDIDNTKGQITGDKGLEISSQALNTTEGKLLSAADLTVDTKGQKLTNQQGVIASNTKTTLATGDINNTEGQIAGNEGLIITSQM
ncbi:filamentous hemagglutinin N-terminal domain-containing protein, partial [Xenorhabdus innexi]|uniref:two-partner secretion domain-containing protein n=2 Tax=Xenorhabdus innexi TaxID=290109 RepID=UPI0011807F49